jgi:biopolymer transport protein ExbB/TolQ
MTLSLDTFLLVLSALTGALIVFKAVELYLPGLLGRRSADKSPKTSMDLDERLEALERGMVVLATIAAIAPFIGLAATVLHIRTALTLIGGATPDTGVIAGPIATALGSTLLGLGSAIPAAAAYNIFARRIQLTENRARRRLAQELQVAESILTPGLAAPSAEA